MGGGGGCNGGGGRGGMSMESEGSVLLLDARHLANAGKEEFVPVFYG